MHIRVFTDYSQYMININRLLDRNSINRNIARVDVSEFDIKKVEIVIDTNNNIFQNKKDLFLACYFEHASSKIIYSDMKKLISLYLPTPKEIKDVECLPARALMSAEIIRINSINADADMMITISKGQNFEYKANVKIASRNIAFESISEDER